MASKGDATSASRDERSKRQERAKRILDAAADLLLRWGYKKTTIEDIAKQAGVAKGTIYLHWKTREALFEALMIREWLIIAKEYHQHFTNDPEGVTLHALVKHGIYVSMNRPLVRAVMLRDLDMLGDLLHTPSGNAIAHMRLEAARAYMELLRNKGMIRTDLDPDTQIKMLSAISIGFLMVDQYMPDDYKFPLKDMTEALAETLHRTFEPPEPPSPEAVKEVTLIFEQLFRQLMEAIQARASQEAEA